LRSVNQLFVLKCTFAEPEALLLMGYVHERPMLIKFITVSEAI
jgi:hypothetical protein